MVTKVVNTASEGDLFNAANFWGLENDTLFLNLPNPNLATIRTMSGNDFVTVGSLPSSTPLGYKFFLGAGNDILFGSSAPDAYLDESGDDTVNMGAGNDHVTAGRGNDSIDGGAGIDTIFFGSDYNSFGSFAAVDQGVHLNLALTGPQNLGFYGIDTIVGIESAWGGSGDDFFHGNDLENNLEGYAGNDYLRGHAGDDTLHGGTGADTLIGDGGADEINLGDNDNASDKVKFNHILDSTWEDMDTVFDFESTWESGDDKIDLSQIDANLSISGNQSFAFRGSGAFISSGGEVRLVEVDSGTIVMVDNDSDATAEMVIFIDGVTSLSSDDFIL